MQARLDAHAVAPDGYRAMRQLQAYVDACGLPKSLLELVKIRASQMNGCAFCINMHARDARKLGETEERIYLLDAWRESPGYSDRERAALAWTEALTFVHDGHVPDAVYAEVRAQFSEKELVDLSFAVMTINAWNRLAISTRMLPMLPK